MKQKILFKNILQVAIMFVILSAGLLFIGNSNHPDNKSTLIIDTICINNITEPEINHDSLFDVAVEIIKKYEGWHTAKNYPYVGYGHKLLKGDKFNHNISEKFATELLKKDLKQKCSVFSEYGKDSLILGVLAYNIGEYKIKGGYGYSESELSKQLKSGNRDIGKYYISHCRWKGKIIQSIKNRRTEELENLFIK